MAFPRPAQAKPVFQRAMRIITNITNGFPALVTTSFDHQYAVGDIVRLDIPSFFGMPQANQLAGTILTIPTANSFTVTIDTTFFDTFAVPSHTAPGVKGFGYQYAQVVPFAEINSNLGGATQNILPHHGNV